MVVSNVGGREPISVVVRLACLGYVSLLLFLLLLHTTTTTTTEPIRTTITTIAVTSFPTAIKTIRSPDRHSLRTLSTTLCHEFCQDDCTYYSTPIASCYSPQHSFPNDLSWGDYDIFDRTITTTERQQQQQQQQQMAVHGTPKRVRTVMALHRTFFASQNGTCDVSTDELVVPLNVCVGPFGTPRPWGTLTVVE